MFITVRDQYNYKRYFVYLSSTLLPAPKLCLLDEPVEFFTLYYFHPLSNLCRHFQLVHSKANKYFGRPFLGHTTITVIWLTGVSFLEKLP